jgi:uncharacterized cupin superfamily protein
MSEQSPYLIKAQDMKEKESSISHPWNPNSLMHGTQISRLTGLKRSAVNLVRIPPGKETFVYHSHHNEEEWIYVISGKGIARINGSEHEVAQGDFMGFPTPDVAHHLTNPFEEELVYLTCGENADVEVADFPDLGKRMIRYPEYKMEVFDLKDEKGFGSFAKD